MCADRSGYGEDLAHIHHQGFERLATGAAALLLDELRRAGLVSGTVVDVGCGSGELTRRVAEAGYHAVGIDISEPFIRIARERVPRAEFRVESFVDADLPVCVAVAAVGEVVNYEFDPRNGDAARRRFFQRVFDALVPAGLFLFDIAGPGRAGYADAVRGQHQGPDWSVASESSVDDAATVLTRSIAGTRAARSFSETHRLQLVPEARVLECLQSVGFSARTIGSYGAERLPVGLVPILAVKPARR